MLILFDIDGTILRSGGVGIRAMEQAGRDVVGPTFSLDGVDTAGRLDPLIFLDGLLQAGIAASEAARFHDEFRVRYAERLERMIALETEVRLMPGIALLVEGLRDREDVTLGLLTGNYAETARMKIVAGGLDPRAFVLGAYGDDGPTRRDLPPVALARHHAVSARTLPWEDVLIIGDTPHDVDCARHHGCRALAVATGRFGVEELRECRPDLALSNLGDAAGVLDWILRERSGVA